MADTPTTVGLLYPGFSAYDDYHVLADRPEARVRLPLVHTSVGEDAHRVDALLDLGSSERLAEGAKELMNASPDSVVWACTSGSFVFGWDGAREQVDRLSELLQLPASSTSIAFATAARHLGLERVSISASYPQDITDRFVEFMRRAGVTVSVVQSHDILTADEVGTLGREQVLQLARDGGDGSADAVLVPDTAMHTLAWLDDLEESLGKPVLTANQVTVWEGLRIAGQRRRLDGFGTLFRG